MGGAYYEQSAQQLQGSDARITEGTMGLVDGRDRSGWAGWAVFAGVIMVMVGTFQAVAGLVALFNDDVYLVASERLAVTLDYTGWGWVHLVLGVIVACAGFAIFSGRVWARTVGVLLAGVSALANILFLAAYPFWSVTLIAMDLAIIYALCVHGGELRD